MNEDVEMGDDSKPKTEEDELKQYDLDNYDEEDETPGMFICVLPTCSRSRSRTAMGPFSNIKGLTYYRNNDEDPYITLKEVCVYSLLHASVADLTLSSGR